MIRLISISQGGDFQCPHCKQDFYVEDWDTEYNDPPRGQSRVECTHCDKSFSIEVHYEIKAYP